MPDTISPPGYLNEPDGSGLVLGNRLDFASLATFEAAVRQIIAHGRNDAVVVDCSKLQYIDGAGLGALAAAYSQARSHGKRLELHNFDLKLQKILTVGYLDRLLAHS